MPKSSNGFDYFIIITFSFDDLKILVKYRYNQYYHRP